MEIRHVFSGRRTLLARRKRFALKFVPAIQGLEDRKLLSNMPPTVYGSPVSTVHDRAASGYVYAFDINGGMPTISPVSQPSHGSLTFNSWGSFTYTPVHGYVGSDSFTFNATDQNGTSDTATESINVTDQAPTDISGSVTTPRHQAYSGSVFASDIDGDMLTFSEIGQPSHGTVLLGSGGSFTYTPDPDFVGQDSFTFEASDGINDGAVATETIEVLNVPPSTEGKTVDALLGMALPTDDVIAKFSLPGAQAGDFSATIDWGNGDTSQGSIVADPNDPMAFDVEGSETYETYPLSGSYRIQVALTNLGLTTTIVGTANMTRVIIEGPGLHQGDMGNMPDMVQGSAWSGKVKLDGPGAAGFSIVKYVWQFPDSAMKGYGTFTTINSTDIGGDPDGPYIKFTGDPSSTARDDDFFTPDDLDMDYDQQGDHVINTFYWGSASQGGPDSVSVTATVKDNKTSTTHTEKDSVTIDILKPTGMINKLTMGEAGLATITDAAGNIVQELALDKNRTHVVSQMPEDQYGFRWEAWVNPTVGGILIPGEFRVTQTMAYDISKMTQATETVDGVTHTYVYTQKLRVLPTGQSPDNNNQVLDSLSYGSGTIVMGNNGAPIPSKATADDNPFVELYTGPSTVIDQYGTVHNTTPYAYDVSENFTQYLMYKPEGSGIWIPVGSLTWQWEATATWNARTSQYEETYADQSSATYVPAGSYPTNKFPRWTTSFASLNTSTNIIFVDRTEVD